MAEPGESISIEIEVAINGKVTINRISYRYDNIKASFDNKFVVLSRTNVIYRNDEPSSLFDIYKIDRRSGKPRIATHSLAP